MKQASTPGMAGSGRFTLGDRAVRRLGYGAMQFVGPGAFGPAKDRDSAHAVLQHAVANGVEHIDTSDFYGPHVVNQLIREALHPYPAGLIIVTKVGFFRGENGAWIAGSSAEGLARAVSDNLRNLGTDVLDVVNLRVSGGRHSPNEGCIEEPFTALAELQRKGLIRHLGLSNATAAQVAQARRIAPVVCVQNNYNVVHRADDPLIDELNRAGIAYVPYFPLGGLDPVRSATLSGVADRLGATPMQVALAWLLRRAANVLPIPGTSSLAHLRENLGAAALDLPEDSLVELNGMAGSAA